MMSGMKLTHVPYRGESLALTDLLGGQVQVVFATAGSSIQYIKAGKLRALAVTTHRADRLAARRADDEEYLPGYEASSWSGLMRAEEHAARDRRKAQPRDQRGDRRPEDQTRIVDLGGPPIIGSPADFGKIIAEDTAKWAKVIQFSGAKAE